MLKRTLLITGAVIFAGSASAPAQEKDVFETRVPPPEAGQRIERRVFVQSIGGPGMPVEFMSAEFGLGGKVVKGAPYTADAVTETTQVLSDGNRIVQKSTSSFVRDSEGRTRRDITLPAMGAAAGAQPKISVIFDPVANVSYTLQHEDKVARKMTGQGAAIHIERKVEAAGAQRAGEDVIIEKKPAVFHLRQGQEPGKTESLGKQTIEGVAAEGTRTTMTIAAGAIGNDRPIEIVNERWYSPELDTVVMSRHADPRAGETVYKLTNIRRTEPVKSLFEVPADYTVKQEPMQQIRMRQEQE